MIRRCTVDLVSILQGEPFVNKFRESFAFRLVEVDQLWFASTRSRGAMGGLGHADSGQAMMLVDAGSASEMILSVLGVGGKRLMWWSVHPLEVVELWVCKSHRKALMVPSCAIMKSVHIQFCSLNEESSPVMVGSAGSVKVIGWIPNRSQCRKGLERGPWCQSTHRPR